MQAVEERFAQMSGLHSALVSLREETTTVTFDPRLTEPEQLKAAVEDMGFDASLTG